MRRWIAATACAGAVLLSAACSTPPPGGTDGDVTDEWSTIGAPVAFKPAAGTCHDTLMSTVPLHSYQPIDCRQPHVTETIFVGAITGAAAAVDEPPGTDSAGGRTAYRTCSERASDFVGAPWRTGLLALTVGWPSADAWAGGARWYRCDLAEASLTSSEETTRTGSLARSLTGAAPVRLGCFNPKIVGELVDSMVPVACTAKHRAEFAGVWKAPEMTFDALAAADKRIAKGCRKVIAKYAGVPDDSNVQYRSGWISYNPSEEEWQQGERGVRCFMWFNDRQMTRSLKGAGPSGMPIRYA